jgi:hypothetical protein
VYIPVGASRCGTVGPSIPVRSVRHLHEMYVFDSVPVSRHIESVRTTGVVLPVLPVLLVSPVSPLSPVSSCCRLLVSNVPGVRVD